MLGSGPVWPVQEYWRCGTVLQEFYCCGTVLHHIMLRVVFSALHNSAALQLACVWCWTCYMM